MFMITSRFPIASATGPGTGSVFCSPSAEDIFGGCFAPPTTMHLQNAWTTAYLHSMNNASLNWKSFVDLNASSLGKTLL